MNLARFISQRIQDSDPQSFTNTVRKIAIGSVAVGLAVLIISFAILGGFRNTIQDKVFSLNGHLQITKFTLNKEYEESPVSTTLQIYQEAQAIPGVTHIQSYSLKPALIKTDEEVQGVVLKGVGRDFNEAAFRPNLVEGRLVSSATDTISAEVVVSRKIADLLHIRLEDQLWFYFLQNPPRYRKLQVVGIYETGLEEFDQTHVLADLKLLQDLNHWPDTLVGGFELFVSDFSQLPEISDRVFDAMDYDLQLTRITDRYPQLFDWLSLLRNNVDIFLWLILLVACFNMISTLIIMIMERTNMIGVFKALGATNWQVRSFFLFNGIRLILAGLLLGNAMGLGLCAVQYYFRIIPLDAENYFMSFVPIAWNWTIFLLLNLLLFTLTSLVLIIPTVIISRIDPVKAIRFD
ncbi:lipoprotein-releasing system permease protein [Catalinimonas alkaloidigena]|uniref:Lipoprotein-releasing system permease protein n=1 Tax=Catalinimonas alkaloidigena TaxID=1075417 RepID=A0A1G8XXD7_9BACT|nr:FtsX-like permease family protein [Catalinimonas alkaloidigena]SDJ95203.1 lipoprotein-releasing system permease protein [Catalinimonas alkaloidigena]